MQVEEKTKNLSNMHEKLLSVTIERRFVIIQVLEKRVRLVYEICEGSYKSKNIYFTILL